MMIQFITRVLYWSILVLAAAPIDAFTPLHWQEPKAAGYVPYFTSKRRRSNVASPSSSSSSLLPSPSPSPSSSRVLMSPRYYYPQEGAYQPRHVVIVGGGLGGLSTAFDAKHLLRPSDRITVVSDRSQFSFVPSNPWVAVGKRKPADIQLPLDKILPTHGIDFIVGKAIHLDPVLQQLTLEHPKVGDKYEPQGGQSVMRYDYLIVATGPRLGLDIVPGLRLHGHSICTTQHAVRAFHALENLIEQPGPVVIGATQEASCFGPAYEYALLLQHTLRQRERAAKVHGHGNTNLVAECPIQFVTPEPVVGHMGLNGAGDSISLMEKLLRKHDIEVYTNTGIVAVNEESVDIEQVIPGQEDRIRKTLPSRLTMMIPPFYGHEVWKNVPNLTDDVGMIVVDEHQQSPMYPNIFGVGVCVRLPESAQPKDLELGAWRIGAPKTGYLIESMGTAAVKNIRTLMDAYDDAKRSTVADDNHNTAISNKFEPPILHSRPLYNAVCITDFGDDGAIFVTLPQNPPRRYDYTFHSKLATLAKIAFEKYFLHKIESGDTDPYYEKYMMKLIGVERTYEDDQLQLKEQVAAAAGTGITVVSQRQIP